MESEFKGYANAMQRAKLVDLSYSDLKGTAIDRFRKYTEKVLKLDLRLRDENWEDLKAISEIRNSLAHGAVQNKQLIEKFIKRNNLPGLLHGGEITLDENNLIIIIMVCRLFVERVYSVALETFPGQFGPKDKA
jgi:hypothetical protein